MRSVLTTAMLSYLCPRTCSVDFQQLLALKQRAQSQTSQISEPNLGTKIWNTQTIWYADLDAKHFQVNNTQYLS